MSHVVTWATTGSEYGIMRSLAPVMCFTRAEDRARLKGWYHRCQQGAMTHSLYQGGEGDTWD